MQTKQSCCQSNLLSLEDIVSFKRKVGIYLKNILSILIIGVEPKINYFHKKKTLNNPYDYSAFFIYKKYSILPFQKLLTYKLSIFIINF